MDGPINPRVVTLLTVRRDQPTGPGQGIHPACSDCGGSVETFQPNPESPRRLIGICVDCDALTIIELDRDGASAALFEIPWISADQPGREQHPWIGVGRESA